jgi:hypothetical protein
MADVMQRANMGIGEPRNGFRFALEPLARGRIRGKIAM